MLLYGILPIQGAGWGGVAPLLSNVEDKNQEYVPRFQQGELGIIADAVGQDMPTCRNVDYNKYVQALLYQY